MATEQNRSRALWGVVILFSLIGLGLSGYLAYLHAKVFLDPGYKSICAINAQLNCESVALSPYAIFLNVPVAVWGLLGYLLFLGIAFVSWRKSGAAEAEAKAPGAAEGFLLLASAFSTIVSAVLAYISHTQIHSLCLFCVGTYVLNPLLLVVAIALLKRQQIPAAKSITALNEWLAGNMQLLFVGAFVTVVLMLAFPRYWKGTEPWKDRDIPQGVEKGHAWIGAKRPGVTIVEFADYQCPHCKIQHAKLRKIVREHKNILRLVHKHYPLDHNCHPNIKERFHPNACLFARAAFCAGQQGKFWPMNDILFRDNETIDMSGILKAVKEMRLNVDLFKKCVDSDDANDAVSQDLRDGMKKGVRGTPTFFINGKIYDRGSVPEKELLELIEKVKANPNSTPAPTRRTADVSPTPAPKAPTPPAPATSRPTQAPKTPTPPKK